MWRLSCQSRLSADGQPAGVRRLGAGAGHADPGEGARQAARRRPGRAHAAVRLRHVRGPRTTVRCAIRASSPAARLACAPIRRRPVSGCAACCTISSGLISGQSQLGDVRASPRRRLRRPAQRAPRARRREPGRHAAQRSDRRGRGHRSRPVPGPADAHPRRGAGRSGLDPPHRHPAHQSHPGRTSRDVACTHPWVRDELFGLVQAAKSAAGTEAPVDGLEVNRGPLTLLARYTFEQHITPRTLTAEELFPAT